MLALLYGAGAPVQVDENLPRLPVDERLARVSQLLGLTDGRASIEVDGPNGIGVVTINQRLIDKMRDESYAARAPIIPWAPHAVANAIEVWKQSVTANSGVIESRTYFLAPLAFAQKNESYIAIAGEDGVLFNVMRADAGYTNGIRKGELIYTKADANCVGTCCERYIAMRDDLVQAKAEVLELQQRNRKLRDRLKRAN